MQLRAGPSNAREQLLHVEERIALCRDHIDRQQALIAKELAGGGDPAPARKLLGEINNLLSMNIMERQRLRRELANLLGLGSPKPCFS